MKNAPSRRIPWPGPRPYDEPEWPVFFGRNLEISEIYRQVVAHRLTVLTGLSGAGKTSLLRAGVVPLLRLRRYRLDEDEDAAREWPVLLLRDWGTEQGTTINAMILSQMRNSAEALAAWSTESAQATADRDVIVKVVETAGSSEDLLSVVRELCDQMNGMILVFDQLEEILRAGQKTARQMTEIIRLLYETQPRIRLILSLRAEHITDLRGLEKEVGGLIRRTYFLSTMDRQTVRDVIQHTCEAATAKMSGEVIEEILRWLTLSAEAQSERLSGEGILADRVNSSDTLDLLSLQAILYELFSDQDISPTTPIDIGTKALTRYIEKHGPEPAIIAGKALQRWISRALDLRSEPESVCPEMPEPELTSLVHRIATRLAPHLSSGDYKVAQEQSDLFRKSLGGDVWGLGLRHPELRRVIRILEKPPRLNIEDLGLGCEYNQDTALFLSGTALHKQWSPAFTADILLRGFRETLARLYRGNILKPIFSPSGEKIDQARSWELVHDRLGWAFSDWAEEQRDTWDDSAASLVALKGISPIMITSRHKSEPESAIRGHMQYIRWEGCVIAPLEGQAIFDGVEFNHCHLRGSIFENCIFKGGGFRDCTLDGVLFRKCRFLPGGAGESAVYISDCESASLGILDSSIQGLDFKNCRLTQLTIKDLVIEGPVYFSTVKLVLGNFSSLRSGSISKPLRFNADSSVYFCSGDSASWELLYLNDVHTLISSGPLLEDC